MKKKFLSLLAFVVLAVAFAVPAFMNAKPVHAIAGDSAATFFGSGTSIGTVVTAVSGKRLIVKEMVITSTASTTVVVQEDPSSGSNVTLFQVGVLANTPYNVPTSLLQVGSNGENGYVTASGSAVVVFNQNVASGTISIYVRYALN